MTLSQDQTDKARLAFESYVRECHQNLILRLQQGRQHTLLQNMRRTGPRLERKPDGRYEDASRRVDFHRWCAAWEACLEANS